MDRENNIRVPRLYLVVSFGPGGFCYSDIVLSSFRRSSILDPYDGIGSRVRSVSLVFYRCEFRSKAAVDGPVDAIRDSDDTFSLRNGYFSWFDR